MSSTPHKATDEPTRNRLRFELIFASACVGFGLLVLPALIYWMGAMMLGPYGEEAGLGAFYLDFFRDLAEPSARAWTLLLGPFATLSVLRLIFRKSPRSMPAEPDPPPASPSGPRRVEPRVSAD